MNKQILIKLIVVVASITCLAQGYGEAYEGGNFYQILSSISLEVPGNSISLPDIIAGDVLQFNITKTSHLNLQFYIHNGTHRLASRVTSTDTNIFISCVAASSSPHYLVATAFNVNPTTFSVLFFVNGLFRNAFTDRVVTNNFNLTLHKLVTNYMCQTMEILIENQGNPEFIKNVYFFPNENMQYLTFIESYWNRYPARLLEGKKYATNLTHSGQWIIGAEYMLTPSQVSQLPVPSGTIDITLMCNTSPQTIIGEEQEIFETPTEGFPVIEQGNLKINN